MPTGCPVCEEPIAPAQEACRSCGYPSGLAADAVRALAGGTKPAGESVPGDTREAPARPVQVDPQGELCDRLARQVDSDLGTLVDLGGDPLSVASDLRQAALSQVDGRAVEALGILRQASTRVIDQTDRLFESRLLEVGGRMSRLHGAGVHPAFEGTVDAIREAVASGDRREALRQLVQLDERLTRLEGDFSGLQGLLKEIDLLKSTLSRFGTPPPEIDEQVGRVRTLLGSPELTPPILEEAAVVAAKVVQSLHEQIPPHLESELARHGKTLETFPEDHAGARTARTIHADAVRHLRRGRITEAGERMAELRRVLDGLAREAAEAAPVAPSPPPTPPAVEPERPASAPPSDTALQSLLSKARGLAARVRRLPPESEIAYEAAAVIRQATELLRSHKLEEADLALSQLMRTLTSEPVEEG